MPLVQSSTNMQSLYACMYNMLSLILFANQNMYSAKVQHQQFADDIPACELTADNSTSEITQ